ncbi:MAG: hypothetical protein B7X31_14550 [Thiomonas sp. 13-66-29]|jgi:hypothetical protein|nr:MAG: hypothetical protein B7X46_08535 [Thiomonas sp. 15-66-11]OZB57798.1 MAG: hypothetical protein B7X31_14550 [Thiomonas sp. 13-66-29]
MLAKVITRKAVSRGFGEAVRYIARDNADQLDEPRPEMGTLHLDCPLDTPEDRQTAIDILDATAAAARNKTARGPVYHVTLAWQEAEHPERPQIDAACAHVMQTLGFAGHEALWALHRDTDHDHVHLIVNRVHADGHTAKVPRYDWLLLDKAMREIELAQGWRHSPGPYVVVQDQDKPVIAKMSRAERAKRGRLEDGPRLSNAAKAAEHRNAGAPSFQGWLSGEPAQALRVAVQQPGATWQSLHRAAAGYGVSITPKGSGLVATTTLDDGRVLAAKASQMGRWASKSALENALGPYVPPRGPMPEPTVAYAAALDGQRASLRGEPQHVGIDPERQRRRAERAQARTLLAKRFTAEQQASRMRRPALRKALTERHRAERQMLTAELRQMRATAIAEHKRDGMLPQVAISYQAWMAAGRREALQKQQAAERRALTAKIPRSEVWRTWLDKQAEQGDEAAKAALRGIRYREQRKSKKYPQQDGIEGEDLDPLRKLTVAALDAQIDPKRQLVIYRGQDGQEKFTDTGPRIVMHDKAADSLEAALRIASQKYGGQVDITGSSEFRERAARQAVRLGIKVANADLQAIVVDEQARMQQQRAPTRATKESRDTDQTHERKHAESRSSEKTSGISPELGDKPAPAPRQAAPALDRAAMPKIQALSDTPREQAIQTMEQAIGRWLDGDRSSGPVNAFIAAHDRATRQGGNGRALLADVVDRVFTRRGDGVAADLSGFMSTIERQRKREQGMGR